jgi:antitoxin component of MazEF toxin-antitoxin module
MSKRLTKTGNSLALVFDKQLLERTHIDADTELEVSTNGDTILISPVRDKRRQAKLKKLMAEAHLKYGDVFRRLAE